MTQRFHFAVHLCSARSQNEMTSHCGKNKKVAHKATAECVCDVSYCIIFVVFCNFLLNRSMATWNLPVSLLINVSWLLHMELASSENHHKPHNIKPRFNNYSIYKKYIYNSQSEQTQINLISQLKSENLNFDFCGG